MSAYFREIGRRGCVARKGTEKAKASARVAATHRWLLTECLNHEDLTKELISLLPVDYEFLSEKQLRRRIVLALRDHVALRTKIQARREKRLKSKRIPVVNFA